MLSSLEKYRVYDHAQGAHTSDPEEYNMFATALRLLLYTTCSCPVNFLLHLHVLDMKRVSTD